MPAAKNRRDIAEHLLEDPRGRNESQWLDTLDYLVSRLADATQSVLHTGRYWIFDKPGEESAALGLRVRAKSPLPNVESDYWEAAVCYTGYEDRAYADVIVFPFLRGSALTRKGRIAEQGEDAETDEFVWYQFEEGEFKPRGWSYPDGPGEWGWVKQPGDEYVETLKCSLKGDTFPAGESIPMTIQIPQLPSISSQARLLASPPRVSLLFVSRDRENTSLVPWNHRPPRPNSPHVLTLDQVSCDGEVLNVDLAKFNIRGGWKPGNYHLAMRTQNLNELNAEKASSEISPPLKFRII